MPGTYPRSGRVHLRLWLAEQIQDLAGAVSLASAPWVPYYARALGAKIGNDVQLHSLPPVTGLLSLGSGANMEPEVDLSGWWIDGDFVHIGAIRIGARRDRRRAQHADARRHDRCRGPGGAGLGRTGQGQGRAARGGIAGGRRGKAKHDWPDTPPEHHLIGRLWFAAFAAASALLALIPYVLRCRRRPGGLLFIQGSTSLSAALPELCRPFRWLRWSGSWPTCC